MQLAPILVGVGVRVYHTPNKWRENMDHILKREELKFLERHAHKDVLALIDDFINVHERATRELKRYRERMVESLAGKEKAPKPVEVLSWTINELKNTMNNCRIDLAVNRGADLARIECLKADLAEEA
jgi:hypothetical protein